MTKDEALKLALEALEADPLEMVADVDGHMVFLKDKAITAIKEALAQPEQEPVAWEQFYPDIGKPQIAFNAEVIGYVAPQRTWVGLTKEEIAEFDTWHDNREEEIGWVNPSEIVAYIEAKLKEKNDIKE